MALGENTYREMKRISQDRKVPVYRKLQVYYACVATKVIYGLETLTITKDIARLQMFEHRTIRRILRIPASMISHIDNNTVMQQAQAMTCLSNLVLRNQLELAGHLARAPNRDSTRIICFEPNNRYEKRKLPQGHQRVGYRPANGWLQ